jgi:hypothetical protein
VVEQWIDNKDDNFYNDVTSALRVVINKHKDSIDSMSILKPFSLVLEDDDKETIAELYVVDDDTVIIDEELMAGLDKDLDDFFAKLISEYALPDSEWVAYMDGVVRIQMVHLVQILQSDAIFL